ncbi:Protein dmp3 [Ancistrocladus abbreviatus]
MSLQTRARTRSSKEKSSLEKATTQETTPLINGVSQTNNQQPVVSRLSSPSFSQRALASSANLAKLLPTGTLLAFQLLTPIFTNNGSCDHTTRTLTVILQHLLAASCFIACFTDSVRASDGQIYYGFATFKGMWMFDYAGSGIDEDLSKYRLRVIDWVHAVMSVLVYGAVALKDRNVVSCFYPRPQHETQEVLDIVPIGIGLVCGLLFVVFPTTRHGIGYPITSGN